jgi:predicted dehydrogenase
MNILGSKWEGGYLDYYKPDDYLRIQVKAWWVIQHIHDMFTKQPLDWRRPLNYLGEYGVSMVARKVICRFKERFRDRKVLATGLGIVVESDHGGSAAKSQKVAFIAPCHPLCVERVVLPPQLITPVDSDLFDSIVSDEGIVYKDKPVEEDRYDELAGWTQYSGCELPRITPLLLQDAVSRWKQMNRLSGDVAIMRLAASSPIREHSETSNGQRSRLRAVLFGLGNHAKTIILPNLHPRIKVVCVHEIDPTQVGREDSLPWPVDSSPYLRADEQYDVYLVAGYHHFHAQQAVCALRNNAWSIVEKPLVTTWEDLKLLTEALEVNPEKYFSGFHMRYNPLWKTAITDLNVRSDEPIHYHCIVFEVPLGRRNWYNWPNSKSRIVSNGCHWIDHFLFLNKFRKPERYDLWKAKNGDLHISIELDNGAVFGMHLTDQGSKRTGVQEHVELRANGVTVRVCNGSRYVSEDSRRIIRKLRVNKLDAYRRMYRQICEKIIKKEPADTLNSIRLTSGVMLRLEDIYANCR